MRRSLGYSLFERSKNHIALNETGEQAVSYAVQLLKDAKEAVDAVRAFDRSRHTITVSSCAPAPLWRLLPALSDAFPDMTLSSSIKNNASVLEDVKSGHCLLAVLPGIPEEGKIPETYCCRPFMKENLAVCVPPDHVLAWYKEVSFEVLNGYNFLLGTRLGFWDDMCREKMPASRFLVQTDQFTMEELIRESSLPCFVTDVAEYDEEIYGDRIVIPVSDQAAKITFHIVYNGTDKKYAPAFAQLFNF